MPTLCTRATLHIMSLRAWLDGCFAPAIWPGERRCRLLRSFWARCWASDAPGSSLRSLTDRDPFPASLGGAHKKSPFLFSSRRIEIAIPGLQWNRGQTAAAPQVPTTARLDPYRKGRRMPDRDPKKRKTSSRSARSKPTSRKLNFEAEPWYAEAARQMSAVKKTGVPARSSSG
jgi:hypothetical protein